MININHHPLWKKISPTKKPFHKARFFLAKQYAKTLNKGDFIGITGSVGKTTTTKAVELVLSQKFLTIATDADLDPVLNIPKTILKKTPKVQKVVLEMGIEYPGEMEYYLSFIRPATAIVTRISIAHSEFLGSVEQIASEKGELVRQLPKTGTAILNWDDPLVRQLSEKTEASVVYYGLDAKHCHIWASNIRIQNYQTKFELNYGVERVEISSKLLGRHQVYPMLAAAAVGINEGLSLLEVKRGLEKLVGPEHRLQVVQGFNDSIILDDTYNSSPVAVEEALETLNELTARRRIVVLGEMRELGKFSENAHRGVARKIYKEKFDLIILGGGDAKYIEDELVNLGFIPERVESGLTNPQIVAKLLKILAKGDVVLVKASRLIRMDEIVKKIAKQSRS
jgi:UDP-N-acetylmuramoyl-tripeptide--D-alanyl-D-alanine ligase